MKKITRQICEAFINKECKDIGNSSTDGKSLYLFGNKIAERLDEGIWLSDGGYHPKYDCGSSTTKERLNGLLELLEVPMRIFQKNKQWYLWDTRGEYKVEWTNGIIIHK